MPNPAGRPNGTRAKVKHLFFYRGFTTLEVSKELDVPVSTVHVHLNAIREKMKREYHESII